LGGNHSWFPLCFFNRTIPKQISEVFSVKCDIKANASATQDFSPKPIANVQKVFETTKKKQEKFAVMPTFPASFPLYILKHSLLFLILYKPNPTFGALSRSLRLQLSEGSANGIKLGTGRFVDIILVVKNVFDIELQLFEILAQLSHIGCRIRKSQRCGYTAELNKSTYDAYVHLNGQR
jgi:hypothetical protein